MIGAVGEVIVVIVGPQDAVHPSTVQVRPALTTTLGLAPADGRVLWRSEGFAASGIVDGFVLGHRAFTVPGIGPGHPGVIDGATGRALQIEGLEPTAVGIWSIGSSGHSVVSPRQPQGRPSAGPRLVDLTAGRVVREFPKSAQHADVGTDSDGAAVAFWSGYTQRVDEPAPVRIPDSVTSAVALRRGVLWNRTGPPTDRSGRPVGQPVGRVSEVTERYLVTDSGVHRFE
ncbi:hypothetical protein HJ590_03860 [Naumannella sp. ID2617S]|nr:hypothetical protein [Naumannella sp. ID2617S]